MNNFNTQQQIEELIVPQQIGLIHAQALVRKSTSPLKREVGALPADYYLCVDVDGPYVEVVPHNLDECGTIIRI